MGIMQAYKMAIKSILSNKGRSFLTMLGVIIGVAAVISAVAFAQGSTKDVTDQIKGMGTNLVQINITGRNSNRTLSYEKIKAFSQENSSEITAVAPQSGMSATVKFGVNKWDTSIVGTTAEYEAINNVHVQSGRFLMQVDVDSMKKVAIVGTAVVNELFNGQDPLGKGIRINGQNFSIIGILEEKENGLEQSADDRIIIPVTVAQRLSGNSQIRNFSVQTATPEAVESVMAKLNTFLTGIFKNSQAFRVINQAQILSTLNQVTSSLMVVLGGIATVSLVVGGIGIMNIMLVSVTERTREIGIRKAVGAKKYSILIQFLIEALMVTAIGGILGIALALLVIHFIIGGMNIVPEVYSLPWCMLSFGISLAVGVTFGMFPAYKASNLNPIDALRFE